MAQDVRGDAVIPLRAGLTQQRHLAEFGDQVLERQPGFAEIDIVGAIKGVDRSFFQKPVGQARGVGHQVADRHIAFRGFGLVTVFVAADKDLQAAQRRDVIGHRIVELEAALFVEHHCRHRGDRLGHRIEAKDGVGFHRLGRLDVAQAAMLQVNQLVAAQHGAQSTRQFAGLDQPGHPVGNVLQAAGRQTDFLRF